MNESTKAVLIVDDETFIRQSFVDYFEDHLWQTFQAESGELALELLETECPDAAVVDIRMSGMDGNDFIRKASGKYPEIAYLICTGSPEYVVPSDLQKLPCVSNKLFRKPVTDIAELEAELLCRMKIIKERT